MNATEYLIQLSESERTDFGKKSFGAQSDSQKVFTAVYGSYGAIMGGGFEGYFGDSDGESAHFAADAYRIIGSPKRAAIMERACAAVSTASFPEGYGERQRLIGSLSEDSLQELDAVTQEFVSLSEPVDPLLLAFVRNHPEDFGPVPETVK